MSCSALQSWTLAESRQQLKRDVLLGVFSVVFLISVFATGYVRVLSTVFYMLYISMLSYILLVRLCLSFLETLFLQPGPGVSCDLQVRDGTRKQVREDGDSFLPH